MKSGKKLFVGLAALAGAYVAAQAPSGRSMARFEGRRYAHRGLHDISRGIPENTLPAFERAFVGGYGAELDVHLTRDGKLAVIHDSGLLRLCGEDLTVEDMDYAALRGLGILGTGYHAPLLDSVLQLCGGTAPLIIEIKTHNDNVDELCGALAEKLDKYKGDYCIESFDPRAVKWFRDNRPEVIRGQLAADFMKKGAAPTLTKAQRFAMTNLLTNFMTRPDFIAYKYEDSGSAAPRITCGLLGAKEISWTIDSKEAMEEVENRGGLAIFERFLP